MTKGCFPLQCNVTLALGIMLHVQALNMKGFDIVVTTHNTTIEHSDVDAVTTRNTAIEHSDENAVTTAKTTIEHI